MIDTYNIETSLLQLISAEQAHHYHIVPVETYNNHIVFKTDIISHHFLYAFSHLAEASILEFVHYIKLTMSCNCFCINVQTSELVFTSYFRSNRKLLFLQDRWLHKQSMRRLSLDNVKLMFCFTIIEEVNVFVVPH